MSFTGIKAVFLLSNFARIRTFKEQRIFYSELLLIKILEFQTS